VPIDVAPGRQREVLREAGIAFLFAPAMHSAMKHVQPVRRELKLRTVFNLLGPLTNPANASAQVVGVYSADLVEKLAEALSELGGEVQFEWKMDGARIQVHKSADQVRVFTRGLNDVSAALPEIVDFVAARFANDKGAKDVLWTPGANR